MWLVYLSRLSLFDLNEMELILELLAKQTDIMHIIRAIPNLLNCFFILKNLKEIEKNSDSFPINEILKFDFWIASSYLGRVTLKLTF